MTVAIFSALGPELELLVRSLDEPRPARLGAWPVWDGAIAGTPVVLARAGLGKVNTAALTALVWQQWRPDVMVFTGVAGGLDPGLAIGDIVIGERSIQHDAGVLGPDGLERYQAGHIPFYNPTDELGFAPSEVLLARAVEAARDARLEQVLEHRPRVVVGTILTGDQFLADARERSELFTSLSAQAIEMEGAAMAQVASQLGSDHLIIRSLSDLASGEPAEDFERFLTEVAANSARLTRALVALL